MTGLQINSLVGDLVAMAQAMERLPQVEADAAAKGHMIDNLANEVISLRADVQQAKDYAASLEAKVHAAEASRDDAELRFLELDEKAGVAVELVGYISRNITKELEKLTVARDSLMPAPQPEPIVSEVRAIDNPLYDDPQVSEVKPIAADPTDPISNPAQYFHGGPTSQPADHSGESVGINPPQGQSEADPTVSSMDNQSKSVHSNAESEVNVEPQPASAISWATSTPPKPQPYAGKRYIDIKGWVSRQDWLDGGGTIENYDLPF